MASITDHWSPMGWVYLLFWIALIPGGVIFAVYWVITSILDGTLLINCLAGAVMGALASGLGYCALQFIRELEQSAQSDRR